MRVIGADDEQLGVIATPKALQLAREKELDLVEVAPTAQPPVCRILDYGKFRYAQAKKEREARKSHKLTSVREIRFRPRIGIHDLQAKERQVVRLLSAGAKVKLSVVFRGREITHPELGMILLRQMAEKLQENAKLEQAPSMEGRFLSIILVPSNTAKGVKKPAKETTDDAQDENP